MGNAMMIETLPEELAVEILLKLSTKSLIRSRCVCKSWYNFIKSPNFIKLHLIKNQNHNYIILIRRLSNLTTTLSFLDYESLGIIAPDLDVPVARMSYLDICGPCNGLICISHSLTKIVLCNPSLREFREIPLPQVTCPEGYRVTSESCCGFGFDSSINDYKVVLFITLRPKHGYHGYKIKCLIYDVGIITWREINHEQGLKMSDVQPCSYSFGVLFNGSLHWIACDRLSTFILCFNLSTEVFRCIKLPNINPEENINQANKRLSLITFNDSLSLFAHEHREPVQFVEIWVLKQYGVAEFWTKQSMVGPIENLERPLLVRKNEILLLKKNGEDDNGVTERQLVSQSLDTDEIVDYEVDGYEDTFRVLVNQESLVPISITSTDYEQIILELNKKVAMRENELRKLVIKNKRLKMAILLLVVFIVLCKLF